MDDSGIRQRLRSITPGSWGFNNQCWWGWSSELESRPTIRSWESGIEHQVAICHTRPDAEFISHAAGDIKALLERIDSSIMVSFLSRSQRFIGKRAGTYGLWWILIQLPAVSSCSRNC